MQRLLSRFQPWRRCCSAELTRARRYSAFSSTLASLSTDACREYLFAMSSRARSCQRFMVASSASRTRSIPATRSVESTHAPTSSSLMTSRMGTLALETTASPAAM